MDNKEFKKVIDILNKNLETSLKTVLTGDEIEDKPTKSSYVEF